MGLSPSTEQRPRSEGNAPGSAGAWPGRCPPCSADHSPVAGENGTPKERDLTFPSPTLLDQLLRGMKTFSQLRGRDGKEMGGLLASAPLPHFLSTSCPLLPLYP